MQIIESMCRRVSGCCHDTKRMIAVTFVSYIETKKKTVMFQFQSGDQGSVVVAEVVGEGRAEESVLDFLSPIIAIDEKKNH